MTRSDIAIGLLWHSASSGNLGVGALTVANMAIVRGVAEGLGLTPKFTILGMRDGMTRYLAPGEADELIIDRRSFMDPKGYWARVKAQDCVLDIGGGDSFTDIYAARRFAFIWGTKALAIAARKPLLLCPQTIGPFSRQPFSAMAAWAMNHCDTVVARDEASLAATRKLAPKAHTVLSADVAFVLPYVDASAQRGGKTARIGINVSGLLFDEAASGSNRFGLDADYAVLMRRLIETFQARGAEVHLLTHARNLIAQDDDGGVTDRLAAEYPGTVRVPDFAGPSEAKSYISGLDFLVSGRMHACIAAVSSGTPVVPVAYSRKFSGVFGLIDYPWLVDVAGKSTGSAHDFIVDCFERRSELAENSARSMQKVDALLEAYREELRRLFGRVAGL
jgi:polysaccharide pyruvyl transferase WcaK-like protein